MPKALIVGAGVGGLATAIALHRIGWQVEVLERAATPRELGFALLLAPNAMLALGKLGLSDRIVAGGVVAERGEIRSAAGSVLRRLDFRPIRDTLGAPTVMVMRTVLHETLLDAVGPTALALGRQVVGLDVAPSGVVLKLADGDVRRGDLLVGADGVHSVVRRVLHGDKDTERRSGLYALRGLARGGARDLGSAIYYGRGCEAGTGRAGPDEVYWFIGGHLPYAPAAPVRPVDARALVAPFIRQLHEPFRAMIANTDEKDLRLDRLIEKAPLDHWGNGLTTLVGDAAHPMLPHAGQGAAQALEDAVVLGESLARATSIEAGLRDYERARIPRTAAIVRLARRNARVGLISNPVACAIRNLGIRMAPGSLILKSQIDLAAPMR